MADPLTIRNNYPGAIEWGPFNPDDFDKVVRTVWGEAAGESPEGQRAVAAVIRNRARSSGLTPSQVVLAPNQFEPWGSRRKQLESLSPTSPEYQRIAQTIRPIFEGGDDDPTKGATHFYSPRTQSALGRKPPAWDHGSGFDIGGHRFFNLGYAAPIPSSPASSPSPSSGPAPMATPGTFSAFDGPTPDEVEYYRRYGSALQKQGMDTSPVGHWTQALARAVQGGMGGYYQGKAAQGEKEGRRRLAETLAGVGGDPQAQLAAVVGNPWSGNMGQEIYAKRLAADLERASPEGQHRTEMAGYERTLKKREVDAPPLQRGVTKEGEIPNVYDPRTGAYTFFQPPGFQPPGEKKRMEERVKGEEEARAKALQFATEADEMARVVASTRDILVGPEKVGTRGYGPAPEHFGKGMHYRVHPEIFGPYEASAINEKISAGAPSIARGIDLLRGGRALSPEERNRQRGVVASRLQDIGATLTRAQNQGQGAVSNYEREMYAKAGAALNDGDINRAISIINDLEKRFADKAMAARKPYLEDTRPSLVPVEGGASPASVVPPRPTLPMTTPAVRGGAASAPVTPPSAAPQAPPPDAASPVAPPEQPPAKKLNFAHLNRAQQRKTIMTMAKNFDNPQAHRDFVEMFGPEAYVEAKAMAEKLRKGTAF
jgi:Cell Wall Hydrolase